MYSGVWLYSEDVMMYLTMTLNITASKIGRERDKI